MFVNEKQSGVVEQRAVAFRNRLQLGDQIGELFHVPAANVPQDTLSFGAALTGRLAVLVGIVVVARRRVPEPREASESLALGQHVGGYARLSGGEGVGEQIALEFR